jgi:hypothetical protein
MHPNIKRKQNNQDRKVRYLNDHNKRRVLKGYRDNKSLPPFAEICDFEGWIRVNSINISPNVELSQVL